MLRFRTILAVLALLLLAVPVLADGDGDKTDPLKEARERWEKLTPEQQKRILDAYERWRKLPEEERRKREEVFEEHLKGTTRTEREELMEKLRQVKERKDLEELRRKQERIARIGERFRSELDDETRAKFDRLPEERRTAVLHWAVGHMFQIMRERFVNGLPATMQEGLGRLKGRERGRRLHELRVERALARLAPEARAELDALPERERQEKILVLLKEMAEDDLNEARRKAAKDVADLLDLPEDELEAKLRVPRVYALLRRLDLGFDHRLAWTLLRLPPNRLAAAMERLEKIAEMEDGEKKDAALKTFREQLKHQ